jgi:hypothetical protein
MAGPDPAIHAFPAPEQTGQQAQQGWVSEA